MKAKELAELMAEAEKVVNKKLVGNPSKRLFCFANDAGNGEPVFGYVVIKILTTKLFKSFINVRLMSWQERKEGIKA